jgi:capsular polysaccharide transport system permease protein
MEVIATDPATSQRYSEILISYAEEKVDNLTQRKREDQMQGAQDSFEKAEAKWLDALAEKERLQIERQVLDPTGEGSLLMGQISNLETLLLDQQLKEERLKNNARPNQAQLSAVQDEIRILTAQIAELRRKVDELARIQGQLAEAETLVLTRAALMQQSLQQLEMARVEANKQTRYLETNVNPTAPDRPTYPRSFENTVLAFLIFSGIYLMASLTASILREQVSA